jgi:hypothetical protein
MQRASVLTNLATLNHCILCSKLEHDDDENPIVNVHFAFERQTAGKRPLRHAMLCY